MNHCWRDVFRRTMDGTGYTQRYGRLTNSVTRIARSTVSQIHRRLQVARSSLQRVKFSLTVAPSDQGAYSSGATTVPRSLDCCRSPVNRARSSAVVYKTDTPATRIEHLSKHPAMEFAGNDSEENVQNFFTAKHPRLRKVLFPSKMTAHCDALCSGKSQISTAIPHTITL